MSLWLGTRRTLPPSKLVSDPCADPAQVRPKLQHDPHGCFDVNQGVMCSLQSANIVPTTVKVPRLGLGLDPAACCQDSKQESCVQCKPGDLAHQMACSVH